MANIRKIEGKSGTSYKITVTVGRDRAGKQIRHYKTWKPDRPMTPRQMEKEVQRVAVEFENQINIGFFADNRQSFYDYAIYVKSLKGQEGKAKNTLASYDQNLRVVVPYIGHLKLADIRPRHLNDMYKDMKTRRKIWAEPKIDFTLLLSQLGLSQQAFSEKSGLCLKSIQKMRNGGVVELSVAEKAAAAAGCSVKELFREKEGDLLYSDNYIHRIHSFVSVVMGKAAEEMLIPYNPAEKASAPPRRKTDPDYLQPDEVAHILELLEQEPIQWRTMIHLFLVSGCRRGEILGLRWSKVDFERQQILIDRCLVLVQGEGLEEGPTKTRNSRYITLPRETMALLKKYRAWQAEQRLKCGDARQDSGYVFTGDLGEPIRPINVNYWIEAFCKRNGLRHIHPHTFRHAAASIMIANDIDIVTVAGMLGHREASTTTDIYAHVIDETKRKATECIADVILRHG